MTRKQLRILNQKFDEVDVDDSQIMAIATTMKFLLHDEYFTSDLCFGVLCLYADGTKREVLIRQLEVGRLNFYRKLGLFARKGKKWRSYIRENCDRQGKFPFND